MRSSAAAAPSAQARAAHSRRGTGHSGLGLGTAGQRGPRPAGLPALDVQRAAGQRQGLGQRPPAGGDGAPGLLLHTRDPHGGGHPRARDRRRWRGLPGSEPLRRARPRAPTTRGRRPPRARTSSTRSPSRCATRRAERCPRTRTSTPARPVRADGDADRQESWSAQPGRLHPGGLGHAPDPAHGLRDRHARATIKGRPVVYTNLRSTYMHELDSATGFAEFNNPADDAHPAGLLQLGRPASATRSTGSTPTTSTSPTSTRV